MSTASPAQELLDVAAILRVACHRYILPKFRKLKPEDIVSTELRATADGVEKDFTTRPDHEVERFVSRDCLSKTHPHARMVGEEGVKKSPEILTKLGEGSVFILDPIDGTTPFRNGEVGFGILLSQQENGVTQAGWMLLVSENDGRIYTQIIMGDNESGVWHSAGERHGFVKLTRSPGNLPKLPKGIISARYFNPGVLKNEKLVQGKLKNPRDTLDDAKVGLNLAESASSVELYFRLALGGIDFMTIAPARPWDNAAGAFINRLLGGADCHLDSGQPYDPTRIDGGIMVAAYPAVLPPIQERLFLRFPLGCEPCVPSLLLEPSRQKHLRVTTTFSVPEVPPP